MNLRSSRSHTSGTVFRIACFRFWTLCSSHSHRQRRVRLTLFSFPPSRPRCPDDASQKRFSWFSDWIQIPKDAEVCKFTKLYIFIISFSNSVLFSKRRISVFFVDLVKSFQTSFSPRPFFSIFFSNEYLVFTI